MDKAIMWITANRGTGNEMDLDNNITLGNRERKITGHLKFMNLNIHNVVKITEEITTFESAGFFTKDLEIEQEDGTTITINLFSNKKENLKISPANKS